MKTITQSLTKRLNIFVFATLISLSAIGQPVCDSVFLKHTTFYIKQANDTHIFDTLISIGKTDYSYLLCKFIFPDTTHINIKQVAATPGVYGPYTFSSFGGYPIIYKNSSIPPNTTVNATLSIFRPASSPTCSIPVIFHINSSLSTVALREESQRPVCSIYPNPATDFITVKMENGLNNYSCNVFNYLGVFVTSLRLQEASTRIDLRSIEAGLYFFEIKSDSETVVKKKFLKYQ